MDFYELEEYKFSDLEDLINNEVEENLHLDYKSAGALSKEDKKKAEITKDVSAFANSDGGIIVYGIQEVDNKPNSFSFVDGNKITKEWLENIINIIQPRINSVDIFPIRHEGKLEETIYLVKIPKSDDAPHMAKDKKYYKRFNFCSEPMEDYEVKDLFYRHRAPILKIIGGGFEEDKNDPYSGETTLSFIAYIKNKGTTLCKDYKLSASFFNLPPVISCNYQPYEGRNFGMYICEYCFKVTSPNKETIYPGELIQIGCYKITLPSENISELSNAYIKMTLRYEDGVKDEILVLAKPLSDFIIHEKKEIEESLYEILAHFKERSS